MGGKVEEVSTGRTTFGSPRKTGGLLSKCSFGAGILRGSEKVAAKACFRRSRFPHGKPGGPRAARA